MDTEPRQQQKWILISLFILSLGFTPNSYSIGATEQGVLYGIVGTVVLQKVFAEDRDSEEYFPQNPNGDFPPFRCSGGSVECSFQRGVWEKQYEEWLKAKDDAYRCGRYGECD